MQGRVQPSILSQSVSFHTFHTCLLYFSKYLSTNYGLGTALDTETKWGD